MVQNGKLSGRIWFNLILFSFIGQLAWNVENMYFNTFLYNKIYAGVSQEAVDGVIPVMRAISLMVALSAATAVITTFVMGTLSDRLQKRKLFISVGYMIWGVITAAFGLISREHVAALFHLSDEVKILAATVWTVILMDCLMTFMGSTSNDSVFNAWVTDITSPENRPKVEAAFAAFPIVAMGAVVGVGSLAQGGVIGYDVFFLGLGAFVIVCGVIGLFTLEEPKNKTVHSNENYWSDLFYGFRPSVIRDNVQLYLALSALCFFSVAVQVFFPYFLIYLQYVILPASASINFLSLPVLACAIGAVAVMAFGIVLLLMLGAKSKVKALVPAGICFVLGLCALRFAGHVQSLLLAAAPTVIGYAVLMIMLNASVRDFTPESKAGQFQGIRMIFYVLIPMVVGPMLGTLAASRSAVQYTDEYGVIQRVPTAFLIKKGFTVQKNQNDDIVEEGETV